MIDFIVNLNGFMKYDLKIWLLLWREMFELVLLLSIFDWKIYKNKNKMIKELFFYSNN